ncbi:subunit A of RNA polymerase II [Chloropicon primus]|uniref:RNA polymerase II subunit A C-terminal domain phosphatase SSU72 n=1 Tax=Chloropicon primus TaxID=1764295 RepID=A0A5B8MIR1_9CHLO|nr:subunit A of RNA polymerase II [Chloropicon primus]UPQ98481.1 subunit A of RNA polymerase II [Chloropicon primus]|eukprot:QDZ19272.1 subunit A of RNA polymerase II [Chloropicon primus]
MRFAMVCASNMNRSMDAHNLLKEAGLEVDSYGVGSQVKLPGPSAHEPNVYPFGTPYEVIYDDLRAKDRSLYERNGMLRLLERNVKVKLAPERWQENTTKFYDVVITFDDVVFDKLMDDVQKREQKLMKSFLVINMKVKDTPAEAGKASPLALQLCKKIDESEDWEDDIEEIVEDFSNETGRKPFYTVCFY